ncbi:hypothetical protein PFISCL1PPCAC_7105, partial [Pristionchus fissidentatus]
RMPIEDFVFANFISVHTPPIAFDNYKQAASASTTTAPRRPTITQPATASTVIVVPYSVITVVITCVLIVACLFTTAVILRRKRRRFPLPPNISLPQTGKMKRTSPVYKTIYTEGTERLYEQVD